MKVFTVLSLIFAAQAALAADGEAVLTMYSSSGAMAPQYRSSEMVEVFGSGMVKTTKSKAGKSKTVVKGPLSSATMQSIAACKIKVAKAKKPQRPNCAGGSSTTAYIGDKLVYIRTCGEINKVNISCVDSMINILDRL